LDRVSLGRHLSPLRSIQFIGSTCAKSMAPFANVRKTFKKGFRPFQNSGIRLSQASLSFAPFTFGTRQRPPKAACGATPARLFRGSLCLFGYSSGHETHSGFATLSSYPSGSGVDWWWHKTRFNSSLRMLNPEIVRYFIGY
jgi:hypothetical protein